MLKILIADDHAIVRRGLKEILLEGFPVVHIEEVADAETLIAKVMQEDWSIVITDISMPGRSGMDALAQIKAHNVQLPVLVLSIYPEEQYAVRALKAGAAGYLNKDLAPDELVKAVNRVLSGRKYITDAVAESLASSIDSYNDKPLHLSLSDREFTVMKLLASGKSVSEISGMLHLSLTTISTYRARILTKMGVKTNASLTQYAIEHNMI